MLSLFLVFIMGCNQQAGAQFDGQAAFAYLEQQCQIGPRYPGSAGHTVARQLYVHFFNQHADTLLQQSFTRYVEPLDTTLQMTNIIAGFGPENQNPLLIGAHWDTRPWADQDPDPANRNRPILGANDGASGVAVLMHLAEHLIQTPPHRRVWLVLFDGEDMGLPGETAHFCLGSEYFARHLPIPKPTEAIIIDMIGDADLSLPIERFSFHYHPRLAKTIWKLARQRGYQPFKMHLGEAVYDDHVPLIQSAEIPAIDIIDFNYPNKFYNYWHTLQDTPDKCSPESLQMVGQVLMDYIYLHDEKAVEKK